MTQAGERDKVIGAGFGGHLPLARRLLAHEAGGQQGSREVVESAENVCQKLRQHLGRLVGPAGFESLLARALYLSERQFPFLGGVTPDQQGKDCLKGVRESVQGLGPAEVVDGLATLIAGFLWLLGQFIGDDMALRQVARLWPEVPVRDLGSGPKETGE